MREIDRTTITGAGVPSLTLMENAGNAIAQLALKWSSHNPIKRFVVICGKGNNGGDGLVAGRELHQAGAEVEVLLVGTASDLSTDSAINYQRAQEAGVKIAEAANLSQITKACSDVELIIDALLGTGVSGEVSGATADAISAINALGKRVLSVDVPSGIDADTGAIFGVAIRAEATVTMGIPKLGLMLGAGTEHAGRVHVVDIGFPDSIVEQSPAAAQILTPLEVCALLPTRPRAAHKGDFGRVLVVAGSVGMTGAAALCSEAVLRAGAGLVYLAIPASLNDILESKVTEVITKPMPETARRTLAIGSVEPIKEMAVLCQVVVIGPGLSLDPETQQVVYRLLRELKQPLVVDADALTALARSSNIASEIATPVIWTPHPGELARLLSITSEEVQADRMSAISRGQALLGGVVVLKGAHTLIADETNLVAINTTGNQGMATGGTGDVLTGMIAGLLAQGLSPFDAARLSVYLHGHAGDLAAEELSDLAMIAGDVLAHVPFAIKGMQEVTTWDGSI